MTCAKRGLKLASKEPSTEHRSLNSSGFLCAVTKTVQDVDYLYHLQRDLGQTHKNSWINNTIKDMVNIAFFQKQKQPCTICRFLSTASF